MKRETIFFTGSAAGLLLLFFPARHAFALTPGDLTNGIVNGGSIWLETTLIVALSHVSVVAFSLQIGRNYFLRVLNKFNLKLGADLWWLVYMLVRDALLILCLILGLLVFLPATFLDYPMAVPLMPLAVVLFGSALVAKLYFDADDHRGAYVLVTLLIFAGTLLWVFGTIFVTESPLFLSILPPGVSATSGTWYSLYAFLSSQNDLSLTMVSFEICLPTLSILGILGLTRAMLKWEPRQSMSSLQVAHYDSSPAAPLTRYHQGEEGTRLENGAYLQSHLKTTDLKGRLRESFPETKSLHPDYIG